LELSGQARVTAVCRSNLKILRDRGVDVKSDKFGVHHLWKPYRVVSSPTEAADRRYRFTICTSKALPDVVSTPDLLGALLDNTDAFVLIQNGIHVESALQQRAPDTIIISACAWVDSTVVSNGTRVEQFGRELLTLGFHRPPSGASILFSDAAAQESLDLLCQLLTKGGGTAIAKSDIVAERWKKVLWNAGYSTICTLTRGSIADILAEPHRGAVDVITRGVLDEVITVASKIGVDRAMLEEAKESILARIEPSDFKPSMLVDLEAGRPIEVEVIIGDVVRTATEVNVSVPR